MATIIDYVRGARTPLAGDLTPADALALCSLIYTDFHALAGPRSATGCILGEVARASSIPALYRHALPTHADRPLLEAAGTSPRFREVRVRDAVTRLVPRPLAQFGAATFVDSSGCCFIAFRGMDATSIGVAEDARFGLDFPTESQRWAARYLAYASKRAEGPVAVMGHSKGGNFALYAAAVAAPDALERVYAFDPVGFPARVAHSGFFTSLEGRVSTYVTAGSWVSPLLPLPAPATLVDSSWPGPLSHNPYAWATEGTALRRDRRRPSRSGTALARLLAAILRVRPPRIGSN